MKMKRLFVAAIAVLCAMGMNVKAQAYGGMNGYGDDSNLQWEGVLGFNLANVDGAVSTWSGDNLSWLAGGRVGVLANYYFSGQSISSPYVNGGLLLSLRGFKHPDSEDRCNAFFFDIPIHFGYRFKLGETAGLFVEAGPYFGIGAFGKYSGVDTFGDVMKRFDLGISDRVGVDINRVKISTGFDYGFTQALDGIDGTKNMNFHIDLGYKF